MLEENNFSVFLGEGVLSFFDVGNDPIHKSCHLGLNPYFVLDMVLSSQLELN